MAFLFIVITPYQPEDEVDIEEQEPLKVLAKPEVPVSVMSTENEQSHVTSRAQAISEIAPKPVSENGIKVDIDKPELATPEHVLLEVSSGHNVNHEEVKVSKKLDLEKLPTQAQKASKKLDLEQLPTQAQAPDAEENLMPLGGQPPIHQRVEQLFVDLEVLNVHTETVAKGTFCQYSFIQEGSQRCENILNKLKSVGVGNTPSSSVSVFYSSYHESCQKDLDTRTPKQKKDSVKKSTDDINKGEVLKEESEFKKSIKSRLVVAQVVASVKSNAVFTFDYLLLLILASIIACLGLVENSSVILVASMLISPLMGPILAATFGQVVRVQELRDIGIKSGLVGLSICLAIGFTFGLITGGVGLHGAIWGSTNEWPTAEMKSRGLIRSLWVGVLIALPSGAGVAISVLNGNAGSLVGVAISASLLPPACNAGMLWAYSFLAAIAPDKLQTNSLVIDNSANLANTTTVSNTYTSPSTCAQLMNNNYVPAYSCNSSYDAALLGFVSLMLTVLNIMCILVMAILVLKIKEVAPHTAGVETFWEDVKVAKSYYLTAKGKSSTSMGLQFLKEWNEILMQRQLNDSQRSASESSLDDPEQTKEIVHYIKAIDEASESRAIVSQLSSHNLPVKTITSDLDKEYDKAMKSFSTYLATSSGIQLPDDHMNSSVNRPYNTLHGTLKSRADPRFLDLKRRCTSRCPITFIESEKEKDISPQCNQSRIPLRNQTSFSKNRSGSKFQVVKVEEK